MHIEYSNVHVVLTSFRYSKSTSTPPEMTCIVDFYLILLTRIVQLPNIDSYLSNISN